MGLRTMQDSIIPAPLVLQIIKEWLTAKGEIPEGGKNELFIGADGSVLHRFTSTAELCSGTGGNHDWRDSHSDCNHCRHQYCD